MLRTISRFSYLLCSAEQHDTQARKWNAYWIGVF